MPAMTIRLFCDRWPQYNRRIEISLTLRINDTDPLFIWAPYAES